MATEVIAAGRREGRQAKTVINSHWEPSLPNAPGKDKIREEASPEAKRSGSWLGWQQRSSLRGGGKDAKPKQAYLYKTCVKLNTQETMRSWGFYP